MNILHMKYAVEVARSGSLSKAAEILMIAQPNLSRSVKELESNIGISIFSRSSKGMTLTPEGEEFIGHAIKILDRIDDLEKMYNKEIPKNRKFSVSVPRVSYISDAFARFSLGIGDEFAEIFYTETNAYRIIRNVLHSDCDLGIIRYEESLEEYLKDMLEEKYLYYEPVAEFRYVLVMHRDSPLASADEIHLSDLSSMTEIAHDDLFDSSPHIMRVRKEVFPDNIRQRIFVFERAGRLELLAENKNTFMWESPLPGKLLDRYGLIQRECSDNRKICKDILVSRREYKLSELDNRFISELFESKRRCLQYRMLKK
ncbi:MAG: LysR family transcriptional regulator [Oscillospiraceae bacterium]|nr:LysR family transcriptional regulator [Oscillospiraceae bacterium]